MFVTIRLFCESTQQKVLKFVFRKYDLLFALKRNIKACIFRIFLAAKANKITLGRMWALAG